MAKLYFRYSAMDAGKTLDLLKVAYNYRDRGGNAVILTSEIDKRSGINKVESRIGINQDAISVNNYENVFDIVKLINLKQAISCLLIDEIHFFSLEQINQIADIVDYLNIPVICYGLRSDYCGRVFSSSGHLLAIADTLEELKTICHCGKKATFNMLVKNGIAVKTGEAIVVDDDKLKQDDTKYVSVCRLHWKQGKWQ